MARSSSPLPIRHSNALPRTPSLAHNTITIDDDDLADTIPCSPSAFLRDPQTTQPTQVLQKPTLAPMRSSSPASSIIEVPASSPFQQAKKSTPLGNRLAPAGTVFRPPQRTFPSMNNKRPAQEPISLISDDEDDLTPPRGDIRPTTFKAQVAAFAYRPEPKPSARHDVTTKLRQIFDVFGDSVPSHKAKEALSACEYDLDNTISFLERRASQPRPASKPKTGRRLISKGALQTSATNSRDTSRSVSHTASPSPEKLPPRRRLVQGLRKQSVPSSPPFPSSPAAAPAHASSDDPLVIDLVDDDKEEAYQAEASPDLSDDEDDRVLTSLNTCTIQELAAMTGMKEDQLECMIAKRPFNDISSARRVTVGKKPGARKASKVSIGENVVEAVEVFLNAVEAIDNVVAKCERDAKAIKQQVDTWDIDTFGHDKLQGQRQDSEDLPPTPTSISAPKYVRPPIAKQPRYMDGHCKMKPFQLVGLNWMSLLYNFNIGCILADEMGLGKTCQVISLISHLVEDYEDYEESRERGSDKRRRPWPNLVVVPPSTYNNWLVEFEKFAPDLSVIGYRGTQAQRAEIAEEIADQSGAYHVVLATYSQINNETDIESMQSFGLNAAIFDEGHKMKNPQTKIYRDLRRIPASWKMLLTGTPVQNNLLEMTSLLNFINPEIFKGCMEHIQYIFSQKVTIRDVSNGAFLYSERVKRARTILEPFILQRRKDQVLSDMPPKICTVVRCDLDEKQKQVYAEYEETFKMEPSKRVTKARGRGNDQNNCWMQLRKAALHPLLFRRHFDDKKVEKMARILMDSVSQDDLRQPDIKHLIQELKDSSDFGLHLWCRDYPGLLGKFDIPPETEMDSGKVKKLLELINQYQENGDRVLVFSKFSRVIELLQEVLAQQSIQHRVLMGSTSVEERQTLIDEFNDDPEIPVFLLTTGAGGTGINLTAANKVIIFDQSDNPQDDIQAENRAHRLGQKRDVEIIRLISTNTIEELIYKACQKKIELANKVTGAVEDEDPAVAEQTLETEVRKMLMEEQMTPP
ncbi:DNA-dependent ATPase fun30 [Fusarium irregulare]|uniref:DNA-dependent ATPase fun30 n=1 Tax=Fusarium irregulare TaxID=2494466 RepID=A0A9W8PJS8_9HYPO|nr:DNA-dependent ATPase fun30 [Fusarium irregulare]KAJ4008387.1 DNA-dependent ATPase fun30 [Fusarium irregulare]